jgi:hypothetical protein
MSWLNIAFRGGFLVVAVCTLLYLAELSLPLGSLLVFLLVVSIGLTWVIINLLKDEEVLTNLFDD